MSLWRTAADSGFPNIVEDENGEVVAHCGHDRDAPLVAAAPAMRTLLIRALPAMQDHNDRLAQDAMAVLDKLERDI